MTISELNADEQLALVALLKITVMSDGHVSAEEVDELQDVVDELGEETYQRNLDTVDARFTSEAVLRTFLKTITRKEAQELIYGVVLELAMADSMAETEEGVLGWLAEDWDIEVQFDESEMQ